MVDLTQHIPLGPTGLRVSRLGIGSSFGAPARVIEGAFDRRADRIAGQATRIRELLRDAAEALGYARPGG